MKEKWEYKTTENNVENDMIDFCLTVVQLTKKV